MFEKGVTGGSNLNLSLPVKPINMRRSREVLLSTSAPLHDPSMAGERHPKTKTTDFKFVFKEFSINLITACVTETTSVPLSTLAPLAKIGKLSNIACISVSKRN